MLRLLPALLALAVPAAWAAGPTVQVGDNVTLASYSQTRGADCASLRPPLVRIVQPPRLGTATVVQSQGNSGPGGRCAHTAVPVTQIVYRGTQPGQDTVVWEVTHQPRQPASRRDSAAIVVVPRN